MTAETDTADLIGGAHDETHIDYGLDLDPYDLSRAVIEDMWGESSVEWLIEQHALDDTPAGEIAHRRALAATTTHAPVVDLPTRRTSRAPQRSAA